MMKRLLAASCVAIATAFSFGGAASAETFTIEMLNADPDNKKEKMVYTTPVLRIQPGDSVTFIPTAKGHNAQAVKGMVPDGVELFKTKLNKEETVTFDTPGVYGYKCTPHYAAGMVGLIIVEGEGWDANLAAAKEVKHRGKARKRFTQHFEMINDVMADAGAAPAAEG